MRNLLLVGAAGVALALGAVSAHAASIQNRPESSPYALTQPHTAAPAPFEGRSAFVDQVGAAPRNADNPVPSASFKVNGPVRPLGARYPTTPPNPLPPPQPQPTPHGPT